MNNKGLLWVLIILLAIPVPFSLLTLPATAMSLASIGIGPASSFLSVAVPFIAMVLASTYTVTYLLSASKTFSDKKISFISFSPVLHVLLTVIFFALWIVLGSE